MSDPDAELVLEKAEVRHVDEVEHVVQSDEPSWDPKVARRAMWKLDLAIMPLVSLLYLFSSMDKSNLGNAKTLGMVKDIGGDKTGQKYALLNALYFVGYAPLMVPLSLFGKRTRMSKLIAGSGLVWGISATCFAAVKTFPQSYVARFFVGLGEAGFGGVIPFYLARFYIKSDLAKRVSIWLAFAPTAGFVNGIVAYGVAFINSKHLASWRILFLLEGCITVCLAIGNWLILPESFERSRWFTPEEREYLIDRKEREASSEINKINWKHAIGALYRWQSLLPVAINSCQNISGAAISAFLPTFLEDNGFEGANAQIATLAPYGAAVVGLLAAAWGSDRTGNRGWFMHIGFGMLIVGFAIYLGASVENHPARIVALILAETGHYIATGIVMTWQAANSGSESRRAVSIPLTVACSQAVAVGSGYLFPSPDGPAYITGSAVILGLACFGTVLIFIYQFLLLRENRRRDRIEGAPAADLRPDTMQFADDAPGFRYQL